MRNHNRLYALLNVLPDADPVVIEAAYKALMKRHHPDIHPADASAGGRTAAELNQAYQTLRDPDRRAAYDADERARHERHRAELARAFEPPGTRVALSPPPRPERASAGQRVAGWIGAAGVLMLGGAIYLLAQGAQTPAVRPAAQETQLAAASLRQAEQAFRDQPVSRSEIEKAVAEFRQVLGSSGLPGAAAYSQRCFDVHSRTRRVAHFDRCVAFDHLAGRGDLVESSGSQITRFQPQVLVTRHIRAAELIARDASLIEARLFEIRRLADNEIGRAAAAAPVKLTSAEPAPAPVARAAVQRPVQRRVRPRPARPPAAAPRRSQPEQDFLERQGGIY